MVTIIRPETPGKGVWVADRRLYLDKDGCVVEGKGANRVSLLVAEGGTLPMETAKRYGLVAEPEAAPTAEQASIQSAKLEIAEVQTPEVVEAPEPPKAAKSPDKSKAAKARIKAVKK